MCTSRVYSEVRGAFLIIGFIVDFTMSLWFSYLSVYFREELLRVKNSAMPLPIPEF